MQSCPHIGFRDKLYYRMDAQGAILTGPFCPDCYEQDWLTVLMQQWPDKPFVACPRCRLGMRISPMCVLSEQVGPDSLELA